jgi:hypothetical protein
MGAIKLLAQATIRVDEQRPAGSLLMVGTDVGAEQAAFLCAEGLAELTEDMVTTSKRSRRDAHPD